MRFSGRLGKALIAIGLALFVAFLSILKLPQAAVSYAQSFALGAFQPQKEILVADGNIADTSNFSDIKGHWARAYIEALASRDIVDGYPDGKFRPNGLVTRAEFAAIIDKAFSPSAKKSSVNFKDVPKKFWAYDAIQSAYRGSFLAGYPNRRFRPNQRIPRVQAIVSLATGLELSPENTKVLSFYQDSKQIPSYATKAVAAATERKLVVNYPNLKKLNPKREATRAEIAAFVYQALVVAGKAEPINSAFVVNAPSVAKNRQGLPKPVAAVDGTFQIFASKLSGCNPGNYKVSGRFDSSFTKFTLTQAGGAEGCFSSVPVQLFTVPGLVDGGKPIQFQSPVGLNSSRIVGSVSRVYGSFSSPIVYPDAPDTFGILALTSQNIKVKDPSGTAKLTDKTKVLTELPAPENLKVSEVLPNLIPDASKITEQVRDTRSNSDTTGLIVVRNKLRVVFSDDVTTGEVNAALRSVGGGIISSFQGGTVVTLKIPDTGDLDGVDNAEAILSTQPKVVTTVPVTIDEVPEQAQVKPPTSNQTPECNRDERDCIPQFLKVVGAVDENGNRPVGLGRVPVNLFIADKWSTPIHTDVNLVNPLNQMRLAIKSSKSCTKNNLSCVLTLRAFNVIYETNENIALFSNKAEDQQDENKVKNSHGFLVAGVMAAQENRSGVIGMYPNRPNRDAKIFAFNAARNDYREKLLFGLQFLPGNHVVNFSFGRKYPKRHSDGRLVDPNNCLKLDDLETCQLIIDSDQLNREYESLGKREGYGWVTEIRQRKLEDKVVFVNSAGNNSDLRNKLVAKAENSNSIRAALRNDLENGVKEEKKRQCGNLFNRIGKFFTTGDPCRTVTVTTPIPTPPLKNLLVVEALDVSVRGDYANYSSIVSNKALAVRAFGDATTRCPGNLTQQNGSTFEANVQEPIGFPALSSNGQVVCMRGGGTSSAAPQVAGLAAWLWSREGNLSAPQVVERIRSSQTNFKVLNAQGEPTNQDSKQTAINVPKTLGIN